MAYFFSAVSVVLSNYCVRSLPKIKISFFLLLIYADELISTPNITVFLPNPLPPDSKEVPLTSEPIP